MYADFSLTITRKGLDLGSILAGSRIQSLRVSLWLDLGIILAVSENQSFHIQLCLESRRSPPWGFKEWWLPGGKHGGPSRVIFRVLVHEWEPPFLQCCRTTEVELISAWATKKKEESRKTQKTETRKKERERQNKINWKKKLLNDKQQRYET